MKRQTKTDPESDRRPHASEDPYARDVSDPVLVEINRKLDSRPVLLVDPKSAPS